MEVKINGNGAIKVDGKYITYRKGVAVEMPESAAKRTGRDYEVIEKDQVRTTVVSKEETDKRYPVHSGGPWYELSNGEKVKGKKEAIEAEKAIES